MIFAHSLELILRQLCAKADLHSPDADEFQARFAALRGSGLLPRGRENRAHRLSYEEIANAVLSIVPQQPGHAGLAAKVLGRLVPAGGPVASFRDAPTLQAAIATLITDEEAREQLHTLTLSSAEGGTNSTGYAQLLYEHPQRDLEIDYFVSPLATSVTRAGGEQSMPAAYRYSPASRETVLNRQFFQELARAVERSALQPDPPGDGEEYDAEEAQDAEYRRLGVKQGSRYLNVGVDAQVTWLKDKRLVRFGRYELVLMPRTATHAASVHIDLTHHRLRHEDGLTIINRFLSWLSWLDDDYAIAINGWSGNPVPAPVPGPATGFLYSPYWIAPDPPELSADQLRALALYREGRNAEENRLVSFAVLSYYKILEIAGGRERGAAKSLIRKHFSAIRAEYAEAAAIADFEAAFYQWKSEQEHPKTEADYIWQECRVAVAHGSEKSVSDPDDLFELRRLHTVADVIRWIAKKVMQDELGVPGPNGPVGLS